MIKLRLAFGGFIILAALVPFVILLSAWSSALAMQQCTIEHSFNTCFQEIYH